jgi:cutinase
MVHRSIQMLPESIKDRITAAVTFGDTQTLQDGGQIQGFDATKTLILCNDGDLVCQGVLIVTDAHRNYNPRVSSAVDFIQSRVGFF